MGLYVYGGGYCLASGASLKAVKDDSGLMVELGFMYQKSTVPIGFKDQLKLVKISIV